MCREECSILTPDLRAECEPAFPIPAPIDFLDKLFDPGEGVLIEHLLYYFVFRDEAVSDGRAESGDILMSRLDEVSLMMVSRSGGSELIKALEGVEAGGREEHLVR